MTSHDKVSCFLLDSMDFAKYGQVIRIPGDKARRPDFESDTISFYGALGLLDSKVPFEFGICVYKKRKLVVEQLEQHLRSQELLYAIDDDFIMPVAANAVRGSTNVPDLENLVAARIRHGEGVIFNRGVWHAVPYSCRRESFALVGFAKGTAKDDMNVFEVEGKPEIRTR